MCATLAIWMKRVPFPIIRAIIPSLPPRPRRAAYTSRRNSRKNHVAHILPGPFHYCIFTGKFRVQASKFAPSRDWRSEFPDERAGGMMVALGRRHDDSDWAHWRLGRDNLTLATVKKNNRKLSARALSSARYISTEPLCSIRATVTSTARPGTGRFPNLKAALRRCG